MTNLFLVCQCEEYVGRGLGSITLRERHPDDYQAIRFVFRLPEDDADNVAQKSDSGRLQIQDHSWTVQLLDLSAI